MIIALMQSLNLMIVMWPWKGRALTRTLCPRCYRKLDKTLVILNTTVRLTQLGWTSLIQQSKFAWMRLHSVSNWTFALFDICTLNTCHTGLSHFLFVDCRWKQSKEHTSLLTRQHNSIKGTWWNVLLVVAKYPPRNVFMLECCVFVIKHFCWSWKLFAKFKIVFAMISFFFFTELSMQF